LPKEMNSKSPHFCLKKAEQTCIVTEVPQCFLNFTKFSMWLEVATEVSLNYEVPELKLTN